MHLWHQGCRAGAPGPGHAESPSAPGQRTASGQRAGAGQRV